MTPRDTVELDACFVNGRTIGWLAPGAPRLDTPTADHLAVLVPLHGRFRAARLFRWITMRWRIRSAERRLVKAGATPIGRFGAWPDAHRPTFVYPLASAASAYAEAQLLPAPNRALGWLRQAARPLELCHPSLEAVIVIGTVS